MNLPYSPLPCVAYHDYRANELRPGLINNIMGADRLEPRYNGAGKLHFELEYEYSDAVRWSYEPNRLAPCREQYCGAMEPVVLTVFDPPSTPVHVAGEPPFVSFKTFMLVQDD